MMNILIITRDTQYNSNIKGHFLRLDGFIDYCKFKKLNIDVIYPFRLFGGKKTRSAFNPLFSFWSFFDYDGLINANILLKLILSPFKFLRRLFNTKIDSDELILKSLEKKIKKLKKKKYDIIIVSVPPHSFLNLINLLSRLSTNSIKIADCRDPWTLRPDLYKNNENMRELETSLLLKYDYVSVVSEGMKNNYEKNFNIQNVITLENGYPNWMEKFPQKKKFTNFENLKFGYFGFGGIYYASKSGKDLSLLCNFFEYCEKVKKAKLYLHGTIINKSRKKFKNTIIQSSVFNTRLIQAYDNMDVAIYYYTGSDAELTMGAKLYEYLQRDKFIWSITKVWPTSLYRFSEKVGGVFITDLSKTNLEEDYDKMLEKLKLFKGRDKNVIKNYSRQNLNENFFNCIKKKSNDIK